MDDPSAGFIFGRPFWGPGLVGGRYIIGRFYAGDGRGLGPLPGRGCDQFTPGPLYEIRGRPSFALGCLAGSIFYLATTSKSLWSLANGTTSKGLGLGRTALPPHGLHGAVYVLAIVGKAYCQDYAEEGKANKFLVEALNQANHLLNVTWLSALVITYLGWALYGLAIVTGQTHWPTWFLLATPLVTTPIWLGLSHYVIRRWTPLFNGAALNLAWVSFYALALWLLT